MATKPKDEMSTDEFILRILGFLLLVTLANLWSVRHFNFGTTNPGLITLVYAGIPLGVMLLQWAGIVDKSRLETIRAHLRPKFMIVLSTRWLFTGYALLMLVGLTWSTVLIIPGIEQAPKKYTVARALGGGDVKTGTFEAGQKYSMVHVFINPFGSEFAVNVDGYLEKIFTVYPFIGRTIQLDTDLDKIPTLFIRPPKKALNSLSQKSRLVLVLSRPSEPHAEPVTIQVKGRRSAYMVGVERPIPERLPEVWRLGLEAQSLNRLRGAKTEADVAKIHASDAQTIWRWTNYNLVTKDLMVEPADMYIQAGTVVQADVVTPNHCSIATGKVTVGKKPFIDLLLKRPEGGIKCAK